MHAYSLDTDIRRKTTILMYVVALGIPAYFVKVGQLFGMPANWGFPLSFGALYGLMNFVFDKWGWKAPGLKIAVGVPDLNGKWTAHGRSSYEDPQSGKPVEYTMELTIKQTFSKIEVCTETADSTSRSTMASLCTEHAVPIFRYAFENVPKNMSSKELQRHPGLIELRINDADHMTGDYFSGKHRLRYGELRLERKKS